MRRGGPWCWSASVHSSSRSTCNRWTGIAPRPKGPPGHPGRWSHWCQVSAREIPIRRWLCPHNLHCSGTPASRGHRPSRSPKGSREEVFTLSMLKYYDSPQINDCLSITTYNVIGPFHMLSLHLKYPHISTIRWPSDSFLRTSEMTCARHKGHNGQSQST
jgi:hypothetical protein